MEPIRIPIAPTILEWTAYDDAFDSNLSFGGNFLSVYQYDHKRVMVHTVQYAANIRIKSLVTKSTKRMITPAITCPTVPNTLDSLKSLLPTRTALKMPKDSIKGMKNAATMNETA